MYTVICCLPAFLLVGFVSFYASWNVFEESFGIVQGLGLSEVTTSYYATLFKSTEFHQNLLYSLKVALYSSVISILLGILFSFKIKNEKLTRIFTFWGLFIILSYVSASLMIYNTYNDKGLLAKLLFLVFGYKKSLNLIFNPSGIGIVLVYILKGTPFTVLATYNLFAKINGKFLKTSLNLGITPYKYFLHIVLPQAKRSIFAIWIVLFNFIFLSYEGFFFLGTSNPKSIGEMSVNLLNNPALDQRPMAMVISALSIVTAIVLSSFYIYFIQIKGGKNGHIL
jgi:putative spermidine/putrescine transport system permease protein